MNTKLTTAIDAAIADIERALEHIARKTPRKPTKGSTVQPPTARL